MCDISEAIYMKLLKLSYNDLDMDMPCPSCGVVGPVDRRAGVVKTVLHCMNLLNSHVRNKTKIVPG